MPVRKELQPVVRKKFPESGGYSPLTEFLETLLIEIQ